MASVSTIPWRPLPGSIVWRTPWPSTWGAPPAAVRWWWGRIAERTDAVVPLLHTLQGSQEVLALGTLIPDEAGEPVLHMHAAAGREGRATVGCTRAGVDVWLVGEVVLLEILGPEARRQKDPQTGFQLLTVGPEKK